MWKGLISGSNARDICQWILEKLILNSIERLKISFSESLIYFEALNSRVDAESRAFLTNFAEIDQLLNNYFERNYLSQETTTIQRLIPILKNLHLPLEKKVTHVYKL